MRSQLTPTMQACTKRLNNERAQLTKTNDDSIHLSVPNSEKLRAWSAVIKGPPTSFYEGYEFDLEISVPEQYPMLPPQIKFLSKIFHPNVLYEVLNLQNNLITWTLPKLISVLPVSRCRQSGEICLDILKKEWSPAWSLHSACRAIVALLSDPAHDRYEYDLL